MPPPLGGPGLADLPKNADPQFLEGLVDRVAVEFNEASTGTQIGKYGGVSNAADRWKPVVGLEEVACLIEMRGSEPTEGVRPGVVDVGRVLFASAVPLDRRHRLLYLDAVGAERVYYLRGYVNHMKDLDGSYHHSWVDVQDQPL